MISSRSFLEHYFYNIFQRQKKWKRTLLATILGGIVLLHLLGLGIFFAIISIWAAAIVSWGFLVFILGAAGVYIHYLKNNRSFSRKSVVIGFWAGFGIIISIFIVSLCMDSFNDFLGFSLSYLAFLICYSIYAIRNFTSDILNASTVADFIWKQIVTLIEPRVLLTLDLPNL